MAAGDGCNDTYRHPSLSPDDLDKLVHHALLHISSHSGSGTAFLIDRKRGFYLTAGHVVKDQVADLAAGRPPTPVVGVRDEEPAGTGHTLAVVDAVSSLDRKSDFAVLQLAPAELPLNERQLELSLRAPFEKQELVQLYGYGSYSTQFPEPRMSIQPVPLEKLKERPFFRMATPTDEGDSGSPVFLNNGNVVGMVVQDQARAAAIVQPLTPYLERIMGLKPPIEDDRLVSVVESGQTLEERQKDASVLLSVSRDDDSLSNIEFALSIKKLYSSGYMKDLDPNLLDCPLYIAAESRDIGDYGSIIASEYVTRKWKSATGADLLKKASEAEREGSVFLARGLVQVAVDKYKEELSNYIAEDWAQRAVAGTIARTTSSSIGPLRVADTESFPNLLERLVTELGVESTVAANIDVPSGSESRYVSYGSDKLAVALNDYALALKKNAELKARVTGDGYEDTEDVDKMLKAISLGAAVAYNPAWQAHSLNTLRASADSSYSPLAEAAAHLVRGGSVCIGGGC